MVDCSNGVVRDQLPDFVHRQLDRAAYAEVAAHVERCAACAAEVALLRDLRATLHAAPAVDVDRIVSALPRGPRPAPVRDVPSGRRSARFDWRVAAAVTALVVGGGTATILTRADGTRDGARAPAAGGSQTAAATRRPSGVSQVAALDVSIDADLAEASVGELEELLRELEAFDGLPASDPEAAPAAPGGAGEGE